MKRDEVFKSNFLKAADLKGRKLPVTIESVEVETIGSGKDEKDKPVMRFRGKDLGLVLNMVNWDTLQDLFSSDDSDDWVGKKILLVPAKTSFGNKRVDCIRIEEFTGAMPATRPAPAVKEEEPEEEFTPSDDDVPFAVLLAPLAGLLMAGARFVA
jgi:hypothetical protein